MEKYIGILTTLFFLILLFPFVNIATTLYDRHLRNYDKTVEQFLSDHLLTKIRVSYPTKIDWKTSPFEKPPNFSFSLGTLKVLGMRVSPFKIEHKIIWCQNENQEIVKIWMELKTAIFTKTRFNLKKEQ